MKLAGCLLAAALCAAVLGQQVRLSPRFRTVYVLEMSNALDQHLASRLSNANVFWVVLDPTSADAVLTDSVDSGFCTWLQRHYPKPSTGSAGDGACGMDSRGGLTAGRHNGTIFLVDPRKRIVLWSTYQPPRNSSAGELDRAAARIASQLRSIQNKR